MDKPTASWLNNQLGLEPLGCNTWKVVGNHSLLLKFKSGECYLETDLGDRTRITEGPIGIVAIERILSRQPRPLRK